MSVIDREVLLSARRRIAVLYMAGSGGEAASLDLRLALDEIDSVLADVQPELIALSRLAETPLDHPGVAAPALRSDDPHAVAESKTSSSHGTDRLQPSAARDELIELWRREFGTITMDQEIRPLVGTLKALADPAVALLQPVHGLVLTGEECEVAADWHDYIVDHGGEMPAAETEIALRLRSGAAS